jgi:hypothetical protein
MGRLALENCRVKLRRIVQRACLMRSDGLRELG